MKQSKWHLLGIFPFLLVVYEFIINLSNDMYTPALPLLTHDLQTSVSFAQMTVISWFAGSIVVHPIIGVLSDYYGRRHILFTGGLLFLVATITCMLTTSVWVLLLARFFQGLTTATLVVAGYASVHELYEDKEAINILSWINSATVLAPIVGPLLGGYILTIMSWRSIFAFIAVAALLVLIMLYVKMPEAKQKRKVLTQINVSDIFSDYKTIISNVNFFRGSLIAGLLYGGVVVWIVTSPFFIMNIFGQNSTTFGLLQIPIFSSYIIGAQCIRLFSRFLTHEAIIMFGVSFTLIASILLIKFVFFLQPSLSGLIIAMSCYCFGFGLVMAPLNRLCVMTVTQGMGMVTAMFDLVLVTTGTFCALLISLISSESLKFFSVLLTSMIVIALLLNITRLGHSNKMALLRNKEIS